MGFGLRAAAIYGAGLAHYSTDSFTYFEMADAILAGTPIGYFANGYPLLIAGLTMLFGEDLRADALLALNLVLSTGIVVCSGLIARSMLPAKAALLAMLAVALWPNQINFARQILTEVPSTACLVLGLLLVLRERLFWGGVALSAMVLLRNSMLPVGAIIALVLIARGHGLRSAAVFTAGFLSMIALERALIAEGVLAATSTTALNLLVAIGHNTLDGPKADISMFTEAERAAPFRTYVTFMIERPAEYLWQRFGAAWELWGPWPSAGDPDAPRSALRRALIGVRFPVLLLAIGAIWVHRARAQTWLIAAPLLSITLVHTAFFSSARYTFSAEPAVLILAVAGLMAVTARGSRP